MLPTYEYVQKADVCNIKAGILALLAAQKAKQNFKCHSDILVLVCPVQSFRYEHEHNEDNDDVDVDVDVDIEVVGLLLLLHLIAIVTSFTSSSFLISYILVAFKWKRCYFPESDALLFRWCFFFILRSFSLDAVYPSTVNWLYHVFFLFLLCVCMFNHSNVKLTKLNPCNPAIFQSL